MALRFLFILARRLYGLLGTRRRSELEKGIEIIVLGHQVDVLHPKTPRPRLSWAGRGILATLAKRMPKTRWSALIVTPATALTWQRAIVRRRWTYPRSCHEALSEARNTSSQMNNNGGTRALA